MILCERCRREIKSPDASTFNISAHTVNYPDGSRATLTGHQWRLLVMLIAAGEGSIVSSREVVADFWPYGNGPSNEDHVLRSVVYYVRRKLRGTKWRIRTVRFDGWRLVKVA